MLRRALQCSTAGSGSGSGALLQPKPRPGAEAGSARLRGATANSVVGAGASGSRLARYGVGVATIATPNAVAGPSRPRLLAASPIPTLAASAHAFASSASQAASSSAATPAPAEEELEEGFVESAEEMAERAAWVSRFKSVGLSRGGQNVNKLATKAALRLPLSLLRSGIKGPKELPPLPASAARLLVARSPYYLKAAHALGLSSSRERSQEANLVDALSKMQQHLTQLLGADIRGETSDAQREKVEMLRRREEARRRKGKERRSAVKSGRRAGRGGWD